MEFSIEIPGGLDEVIAQEFEERGYSGSVIVALKGGGRYLLSFVDAERLADDIEYSQRIGEACFADGWLVVVPKVTYEAMVRAVTQLCARGHFAKLVPIHELPPTLLLHLEGYL